MRARLVAELLAVVEGETPYGGRTVGYEPLGPLWLGLRGGRGQDGRDGGREGVGARETRTAEARADARLSEGRVARFGGADWTIARIDPDPERPGRVSLRLERAR